MDPIRFPCEGCGKTVRVDGRFVGRSGRCPGCGRVFVVPLPQDQPANKATSGSHPAPEPAVQRAPTSRPQSGRYSRWLVLCLMVGAAFWNYWFGSGSTRTKGPDVPEPVPLDRAGISREQLGICSEMIELQWRTWRPGQLGFFGWTPTADASNGCAASSAVIGSDGARLRLVTNRHVLMLPDIMATKTTDMVIQQYDMSVRFPTGQVRPVCRIGHQAGPADLALLEVDATGLKQGVDYIMLGMAKDLEFKVLDEVVAIGSPLGLQGTETLGHVSRLVDGVIQIDAAINHGNSGGPLLVKQGDRYFWIGINTWGVRDQESQGLNFAIATSQLSATKFVWYDASKEGTAAALRDLYQFPTGTGGN
jgi:hypothetical protein